MARNKAATILEAARALLTQAPDSIKPTDAGPLMKLIGSPYLTSPELHYLHDKLAEYSGRLAMLGFIYSDLAMVPPGPVPGAVQLELPGVYKVDRLTDLSSGIVDAGAGRKFMVLSWGGAKPGTLILRRNSKPECWVEVAQYLDRKEPEAAVSCLLLGEGDRGTPFDGIKRDLQHSERRYWRDRNKTVQSALRDGRENSRREEDASRDP